MLRRASVVIPTFNRKHKLLRCLRSLPRAVEVIVVDDGSTDGTPGAVAAAGLENVTLVRQENRGPAAARNRGVQEAKGEVILFTDDDCVPSRDWADVLTAAMVAGNPELGAIGGSVAAFRQDLFSRYYVASRILEPPDSLSYVVTANCAVRRSAFERVGGFPPDITWPGGEDPALSGRIRGAGFRIGYEPRAVVQHDFRPGVRDFVRTFFRYGRGCAHVVDG